MRTNYLISAKQINPPRPSPPRPPCIEAPTNLVIIHSKNQPIPNCQPDKTNRPEDGSHGRQGYISSNSSNHSISADILKHELNRICREQSRCRDPWCFQGWEGPATPRKHETTLSVEILDESFKLSRVKRDLIIVRPSGLHFSVVPCSLGQAETSAVDSPQGAGGAGDKEGAHRHPLGLLLLGADHSGLADNSQG